MSQEIPRSQSTDSLGDKRERRDNSKRSRDEEDKELIRDEYGRLVPVNRVADRDKDQDRSDRKFRDDRDRRDERGPPRRSRDDRRSGGREDHKHHSHDRKGELREFFDQHKEEKWLRDRYHPASLARIFDERSEEARVRAKKFLEELPGKAEEFYNLIATEEDVKKDSKSNNDDDQHEGKLAVLSLQAVPSNIGLDEVLPVVKSLEGFSSIAFSEPDSKNFQRNVRVTFFEMKQAEDALRHLRGTKIGDFEPTLAIETSTNSSIRIAPGIASSTDRLVVDAQNTISLINVLDNEKKLSDKLSEEYLDDSDKMRQEKLMDVRIHYLRFVHIFCYYCGEEFLDFEEMARKCGGKHLRPPTPSETDENSWSQSLDSRLKKRMENPTPLGEAEYKKQQEGGGDDLVKSLFTHVDDTKWSCKLCPKSFSSEPFVLKHINSRHPDAPEEEKKKIEEDNYFQNYLNDPNHPTPKENNNGRSHDSGRNNRDRRHDRDNRRSIGSREASTTDGRVTEYLDLDAPSNEAVSLDYSLPSRKRSRT